MAVVTLKNLGTASFYSCFLVVVILISEKLGIGVVFGYAFSGSLPLLLVAFFIVNRGLYANVPRRSSRLLLIAILSIALTLVVAYLAFVLAVNANLALGGAI